MTGNYPRVACSAIDAASRGGYFLMSLFAVFVCPSVGSALGANPADLAGGLPATAAWLIPAVGFLAVASVFIILTEDLKAMLHLDLKLSKLAAWAIALGVPPVLLVFVTRDFLGTVGFVGAIFGATNGLLVSWMAIVVGKRGGRNMHVAWRLVVPSLTAAVFLAVLIWRILII